jgi:hypothetical protein
MMWLYMNTNGPKELATSNLRTGAEGVFETVSTHLPNYMVSQLVIQYLGTHRRQNLKCHSRSWLLHDLMTVHRILMSYSGE